MGYSARYHAVSLAAVFVALAIGVLIGVGFGDDVVSGTSENLQSSLRGDLDEARSEVEEVTAELEREREFGRRVFPGLVGTRLVGRRVGIVALGELPGDVGGNVEDALDPTGAELAAVAVVREPPDARALLDGPLRSRFGRPRDLDAVEDYGRAAGRQLVDGGPLLEGTSDRLLSRVSGELADLDAVVVVREPAEELEPDEREAIEALESGILDGIVASGAAAVGVERSDDEASSVELFDSFGIPTVDDVDLVAGRVAMVMALEGAEGNYGVKPSADRLLPDLLQAPPSGGLGAR